MYLSLGDLGIEKIHHKQSCHYGYDIYLVNDRNINPKTLVQGQNQHYDRRKESRIYLGKGNEDPR